MALTSHVKISHWWEMMKTNFLRHSCENMGYLKTNFLRPTIGNLVACTHRHSLYGLTAQAIKKLSLFIINLFLLTHNFLMRNSFFSRIKNLMITDEWQRASSQHNWSSFTCKIHVCACLLCCCPWKVVASPSHQSARKSRASTYEMVFLILRNVIFVSFESPETRARNYSKIMIKIVKKSVDLFAFLAESCGFLKKTFIFSYGFSIVYNLTKKP